MNESPEISADAMNPHISSQEREIENFLKTLNEKEKKSYEIAKSFLGSSFDVLKCNVFLEYQKAAATSVAPPPPHPK